MNVTLLHRVRRVFLLALTAVLLVACGSGSARNTEPESTATVPPLPTAEPGELAVGELLERVDAAWPDVTSMRMSSTSGPVPTDDPATATAGTMVTYEEWTAPNNRRIVEETDDGIINEQLFVDGRVFMWGLFVVTSVAPEVGPTTWVTIDPSVIPQDTPVGYRVTYLTRDASTPFVFITEEMRQRSANESGQVQVGDRTCTVYTFVDSTRLGERIDYELALDQNNLPCQLVQRTGGFQNSIVYDINDPEIEILAPDTPTPVSGTPEG